MKLEEVQDRELQEELRRGVGIRANASELGKKAKELTGKANDILIPALTALEDEKVEVEGVGTASIVRSQCDVVKLDRFKEALVRAGVGADVVRKAEDSVRETTTRVAVRFTAWRK